MSDLIMMTLEKTTKITVHTGEEIEIDGDYILIKRDRFDDIVDDASSWLQSGRQGKSSDLTFVKPFPDYT